MRTWKKSGKWVEKIKGEEYSLHVAPKFAIEKWWGGGEELESENESPDARDKPSYNFSRKSKMVETWEWTDVICCTCYLVINE